MLIAGLLMAPQALARDATQDMLYRMVYASWRKLRVSVIQIAILFQMEDAQNALLAFISMQQKFALKLTIHANHSVLQTGDAWSVTQVTN
jgi:ABC-type Mn2+/Zn2+ transport system permease subunit